MNMDKMTYEESMKFFKENYSSMMACVMVDLTKMCNFEYHSLMKMVELKRTGNGLEV